MARSLLLLCACSAVAVGIARVDRVVGTSNAYSSQKADPIKQVYILFSNHLDVGYTLNHNGSSAGAVVNEYFHKHFPTAIQTASEMKAKGQPQYRWMAHSWLLDLYFNCEHTKINILGPDHPSDIICPNATQVAAVDAAVRLGTITYHAFPFNAEPEMYNQALFDTALNMTFRLDDRFGHAHRQTLSQRDVPGLTRNAIPLLTRRGVRAVSVGENSQCAPMAVPPIFKWRDNATDTEVIALFHALGYGQQRQGVTRSQAVTCNCSTHPAHECSCADDPRTLYYIDTNGDTIMKAAADPYDDGPGMHVDSKGNVHASRWEHCVDVEEAEVAICYAWKVDNSGPHTAPEAELLFNTVGTFYPGAKISASDAFDDFVDAVLPHIDALPMVSAELGDTWIMGADSDPLKVSLYRSAARQYQSCIAKGDVSCVGSESADIGKLRTFERLLLTSGEHTWGWNGGDTRRHSWSNEELAKSLADHSVKNDFWTSTGTWKEQRAFIANAVAALPPQSPLAQAIKAEHDEITAYGNSEFDSAGFVDTTSSAACNDLVLSFDTDGSINNIAPAVPSTVTPITGKFFQIWYHNLDHEYISAYARDYIAGPSLIDPEIIAENLVKPNMRLPSLSANASLLRTRTNQKDQILLDLAFPNAPHEERGAPSHLQALLTCPGAGNIEYSLRWFNKTSTHAPETIWVSNLFDGEVSMVLDKIGLPLNPLDADLGCNGERHTCGVHLHAVGDRGIEVESLGNSNDTFSSRLGFVALDNALVSVGSADPVPTPLRRPNANGGIHYALVGNIWNTNYPVWYPFVDEDSSSQFRFSLSTHCANHACENYHFASTDAASIKISK